MPVYSDDDVDAMIAPKKKTYSDAEVESMATQSEAAKPSKFESGFRGGAMALTAGTADELGAGAQTAADVLTGKTGLGDIKSGYRSNRDRIRGEYKAAREANPGTYDAFELGGGLASSLNPLGKLSAPVIGAIQGFGYSEADDAQGLAQDAAMGGALGKVGEKVGQGVAKYGGKLARATHLDDVYEYLKKKVPELTAQGSKKLLSAVGGVQQDNIEKYMAAAPRINAARPFPIQADDVHGRVGQLQEQVVEGSRAATELIPEKGAVSAEPVRNTFKSIDKGFRGAGGFGADAQQARGTLGQRSKEFDRLAGVARPDTAKSTILDQYGNKARESVPFDPSDSKIPLRDLKKIIKNLDKETEYKVKTGAYGSTEDIAKKEARRSMDEVLKGAVDPYREAMVPVAADAAALGEASKHFGGRDQVQQRLETIGRRGEKKPEMREALKNLASRTKGPDLVQEAEDRIVQEAFTKDATRGSKHVNLYKALGAGVGGVTGALGMGEDVSGGGALGGGAGGAMLGAAMGTYGPAATKQLLNAYMKSEGVRKMTSEGVSRILKKAAERGPDALKSVQFLIAKEFPQFREMLEDK